MCNAVKLYVEILARLGKLCREDMKLLKKSSRELIARCGAWLTEVLSIIAIAPGLVYVNKEY
jgi:hypothetical protein